jgi:hypothetical protein
MSTRDPVGAIATAHARLVNRALRGDTDAMYSLLRVEAPHINWPEVEALIEPPSVARPADNGTRTVPPPMPFGELLTVPDPVERDLVAGLVPTDANILLASYPKSHKTNIVLELAVALASATMFLCRYPVAQPHRVGLVLMEDARHRVRRRLERMCMAHDVDPASLSDRLHLWFRPPIRLADPTVITDLKAHAADLELDLLGIDNWSYVSTGDSNDADLVTQQLGAFSSVREARAGMSVLLVQHARKQGQDRSGERLTDIIRNSSAFGAWYDAGFVLSRTDEHSPVTVRAELRDRPAPAPFAFTVEDEFPGDGLLQLPGGYLRLAASERTPAAVQRQAGIERFVEPVREFLGANPGASKAQLKGGVTGDNALIEAAFEVLVSRGEARFDAPEKRGLAGYCWLVPPTSLNLAATSLDSDVGGYLADLAAPPLKGARSSEVPDAEATEQPTARSATFACTRCGKYAFHEPDRMCMWCRKTQEEAA